MTLLNYILKSLWHFRKQHFALLAATAISAAVLTGALIVGDSVKYSLNKQVTVRLGKTTYALVGNNRFVRSQLATELAASLQIPTAPLLQLQGIAVNTETGNRINNAKIIGIDSSFSHFSDMPLPVLKTDEVIISENVAQKLNLKVNDDLLVRVESVGLMTINTPLAQEKNPSIALRLSIKAISTDSQLANFNLNNEQINPYNIFVSLDFLSKKMELSNLANTILISDNPQQKLNPEKIQSSLKSVWKIDDLGLKTIVRDSQGTYDLVSDRVFIDEPIEKVINKPNLQNQPIITYLVNTIRFSDKQTPYSFATAAASTLIGESLLPNEVIIIQWTASDLEVEVGDSIKLDYYVINALRELNETSRQFVVKRIIPNTGNGIDNSLMPKFQGLSDAGSCRDWNTGVPIDLKRIRDKDEKYWNDYKGTPKVLLSLETGRNLWSNPFGTLTGIRFSSEQVSLDSLRNIITTGINPQEIGLQIIATQYEGNSAANNAVNFAELFLSLSFFIIAAAILLLVLIFSLHAENRSREMALLNGLGFQRKTIQFIWFMEPTLVIIVGSIVGSILGIFYNYGVLAGLNTVWNDAVHSNALEIYINPFTILIGALSSTVTASLSIYWVVRQKLRQPIAGLMKNQVNSTSKSIHKKKSFWKIFSYAALLGAMVLVSYSFFSSRFENAGMYLSAAGLFLIGSILFIYHNPEMNKTSSVNSVPSKFQLAFKNIQRNRNQSIAVISLLAIGTFTLILTGAYRKTFYGSENLRNSGTGGYLLWSNTTAAIPYNLNSTDGKSHLNIANETDLDSVRFLQFQSLEGDDASCLNLNQAQRPRILAVNTCEFDSCEAFSFAKLLKQVPVAHPWKELDKTHDNNVFSAYADQTVIQYGLKKSIGDTLFYRNEMGKPLKLVLAGGLNNSIFQGNILISDQVFREQFPSSGGSKTMLIDAPKYKQELVAKILEQSLIDYGMEVTPTSRRLATFNSVENTYLSVFMALSGLGFLIGTIGLGIVLLRNIVARKHELALLTALGFNRKQLFRLVYMENFMLLATGMFLGVLAALVGILPSLLSPSFSIQGGFLMMLIGSIFISGALWIYFPLRIALNRPSEIVTGLNRQE
ncbi:MAG: FtsX-like permease family protein [Salinivirgaceae bacterium]